MILQRSKVTTDGKVLWTRLWGSTRGDVGYDVVADDAGRLFVTGHAPNDAPFDEAGGLALQSRHTYGMQFLTEFTVAGAKAWSRTWGSTNCSAEAIIA